MGIILGAIIALIRTTHDNNGTLPIPNLICKIYLTVVRGTPAMVQLLIFYYIILVSVNSKILVAIIAFGLNSAAYVAEVIRSGINSSGYIAIVDLTKAGDIIRGNTYDAFLPLITVAIIYLVIVIALTSVANALERRLRANERH